MKTIGKFIVYIAIMSFVLSHNVQGQYQIPANVLGSGGGAISNSTYKLSSTAGQTFIGQVQSSNFRKHIGFWRPAQLIMPVEELTEIIPYDNRLDQNYPNPFNPSTTIKFALKERSHVKLVVFNMLGQNIAILVNEELIAGEYETFFSPENLASGFYVYRLTANDFVQSRRMLFLK